MSRKGKKKETLRKKVAEKAVSAPKELAKRGLNDGTERIREQFRDNRVQERPEDYGSEKIEGGAQRGAALVRDGSALAKRSVQAFLNRKKQEKENSGQYEAANDFPVADDSEHAINTSEPVLSESPATAREGAQPFENLECDMGLPSHGGTRGTQAHSAPRDSYPSQPRQQSEPVIKNNAPQESDWQRISGTPDQIQGLQAIRATPENPQSFIKEKPAEARIARERDDGRLIREKTAVSSEARVVKEWGTSSKLEAPNSEHPSFRPSVRNETSVHAIAGWSDYDQTRNRGLSDGMPDGYRIERTGIQRVKEKPENTKTAEFRSEMHLPDIREKAMGADGKPDVRSDGIPETGHAEQVQKYSFPAIREKSASTEWLQRSAGTVSQCAELGKSQIREKGNSPADTRSASTESGKFPAADEKPDSPSTISSSNIEKTTLVHETDITVKAFPETERKKSLVHQLRGEANVHESGVLLSEKNVARTMSSEQSPPRIKERQDFTRKSAIREKNSSTLNGCVPESKEKMPLSAPDDSNGREASRSLMREKKLRESELAAPNQLSKSLTASGEAKKAGYPLFANRKNVNRDPMTVKIAKTEGGSKEAEAFVASQSPRESLPLHYYGARRAGKETVDPSHEMEMLRSGRLQKGAVTARRQIKEGKASIKTFDLAAKQTVKAFKCAQNKVVRDARHTTEAAEAMARNGNKASRVASQVTRNTVRAVRNTAHDAWQFIKLSRRTIEAIASTIASGGGTLLAVVLVVLLVICMVALLMATPYGIFLSSEYSDSGQTLQTAITSINGEFSLEIEQIQANNPHDILDMDNTGISAVIHNWNDVLAVYAVKITTDSTTLGDAATMTSEKMNVLRKIFWDMTQISYSLETKKNTDTGENQSVLRIAVTTKSKEEIAAECAFTPDQLALLDELSQSEYAGLFAALPGSDKNLTLSPAQMQQLTEQLVGVSAQRQQVVMTAYQLLGKVNYFWGGCALFLDNLRRNTQ